MYVSWSQDNTDAALCIRRISTSRAVSSSNVANVFTFALLLSIRPCYDPAAEANCRITLSRSETDGRSGAAEIDAYAAAHSLPETPVRKALREETERTMEFARMLVGPLEGAFLHMMTRLVQASGCWKLGCLRDTARSVLPKHCPKKVA